MANLERRVQLVLSDGELRFWTLRNAVLQADERQRPDLVERILRQFTDAELQRFIDEADRQEQVVSGSADRGGILA